MCNDEEASGPEIPAASIGDVDLISLGKSHPKEAAEIARIEGLLGRGAECHEEFLRLCELLRDFGDPLQAEYLLRLNIDRDHEEAAIEKYFELFGAGWWGEYQQAIEVFQNQFRVSLTGANGLDFMAAEYETEGSAHGGTFCELLGGPCTIEISYEHKDFITAILDIPSISDLEDEWVVDDREAMKYVDGAWVIISMDEID